MARGGPPKENVGPTQGWTGGPPAAPGPRARADAGIPASGGPAQSEALPADEAQAEAERVARRTGTPDPERE
jgi:hypothetical protein